MRLKNLLLLIFSILIILSATDLRAEKAKKHSFGFDLSVLDYSWFQDEEPGMDGSLECPFNLDINISYDHHLIKYFSFGAEFSFFKHLYISEKDDHDMFNFSFRINLRFMTILPFHNDKVEVYFLTRGGIVFARGRFDFMSGPAIFGGFGLSGNIAGNFWLGALFDTGAEFIYHNFQHEEQCNEYAKDCRILGWHFIRAFLTFNYRF